MKKLILEGKTGSGKTYYAIKEEEKLNNKFVYIAPCRQLVYETFMEYSRKGDSLKTGEVSIEGSCNMFSVYESLNIDSITKYDTVIIDEAHFISDEERGIHLMNIVLKCLETNTNIVLVTATRNFNLKGYGFTIRNLEPRFKVPTKKEIDYDRFLSNIEKGMQTIMFTKTISDTEYYSEKLRETYGVNAVALNADISPSERLQTQIDFANKKIQVVVCTNVLAQGVNFECENIYIPMDLYNTPELVEQKLGRLGRPFKSKRNEVYYCLKDERLQIEKIDKKLKKGKSNKDFVQYSLKNALSKCKYECSPDYREIKYCIGEFQKEFSMKEKKGYTNKKEKKMVRKTVAMIKTEQNLVKNIVLTNLKYK